MVVVGTAGQCRRMPDAHGPWRLHGVVAPGPRFVRVLVAEDPSVPGSCRSRLASEPHVIVVGDSGRMEELPAVTARVVPRVVVIATTPVGPTTLDVVRAVCAATADVVLVSTRTDEPSIRRALEAGVRGYALHDDEGLGSAVRAVAAGGAYFSPDVASVLRAGYLRAAGVPVDRLLTRLTAIERVMLRGLVEGLTNRELAIRLGLPIRSIDGCRARIAAKVAEQDVVREPPWPARPRDSSA
jgi:DNA-binding NarL/FixJ family response regulator